MDEEGNQFVAYFLPVDETMKKRKRDQEEEMDYAPDDVYVGVFCLGGTFFFLMERSEANPNADASPHPQV